MVLSCLGSHRASILPSGPNPDKPGVLQLNPVAATRRPEAGPLQIRPKSRTHGVANR
jgi:hypothetical protein